MNIAIHSGLWVSGAAFSGAPSDNSGLSLYYADVPEDWTVIKYTVQRLIEVFLMMNLNIIHQIQSENYV